MSEAYFSTGDTFDDALLALEKFNASFEHLDGSGKVRDLDTHEVVFVNLAIFGQRISTVGAGMTNAALLREHSEGRMRLNEAQRYRSAVLHCVGVCINDTYSDLGKTARAGVRGSLESLGDDGPIWSPLKHIGTSFPGDDPGRLPEFLELIVMGGK
jgi:hypothetical protein